MRVTFVVRNPLQRALYDGIVDSPFFVALGGTASWLMLESAETDSHRDAYVLGGRSELVGRLTGIRTLASRERSLNRLQAIADRAFDEADPDVVVVANDRPFAEQTLLRMANRRGIPSVLIQDGFIPSWRDLDWASRGRLVAATATWRSGLRVVGAPRPGYGSTDYCGVMGYHWKSMVRARSGDPSNVVVVGQPLFDAVVQAARQRSEVGTDGSSDASRQVLFVATDFASGLIDPAAHEIQIDDIRAVSAALKRRFGSHYRLVVRPHPLEDDSLFEGLRDDDQISVDGATSFAEAILRSDMVVANISSALLAAVVVRVPTLVFSKHLSRGRYRRLMHMYPCQKAHDDSTLDDFVARLESPWDRASWVAENAARSASHVYVDADRTASDLAAFLVARAAGRTAAPPMGLGEQTPVRAATIPPAPVSEYLASQTYLDYLIANCGVRGYDFDDRSEACTRPDVDIILRYCDLLKIQPGDAVLEVGCGIGRILKEIHDQYFVQPSGIDLTPSIIEAARARVGAITADLRISAAERIDHPSEAFAVVLCWGTFDLTNQESSLREIARVLKVGGRLLLTGKSDRYHEDDAEARIAEQRSREKGIPNHYTDYEAMIRLAGALGLEPTFRRYFERRGDFMNDAALTHKPDSFYEWLVLFEKKRRVATADVPEMKICDLYSRTYRIAATT